MSQTIPGSLQIRTELQPTAEGVLGATFPSSTSFQSWKEYGSRLMKAGRSWPWKVGDWIFYGEVHFGERYREAMESTGLEYQTLANYAYVAGRFDISRRREELTWAHHSEVASIGSDEDQDAWLETAIAEGWNVKELRAARKQKALSEGEQGRDGFESQVRSPSESALSEADATEASDATEQEPIGPAVSVSERALSEGGSGDLPVSDRMPDVGSHSPSESAFSITLTVQNWWIKAAEVKGQSLEEWATAVLDEAAMKAAA